MQFAKLWLSNPRTLVSMLLNRYVDVMISYTQSMNTTSKSRSTRIGRSTRKAVSMSTAVCVAESSFNEVFYIISLLFTEIQNEVFQEERVSTFQSIKCTNSWGLAVFLSISNIQGVSILSKYIHVDNRSTLILKGCIWHRCGRHVYIRAVCRWLSLHPQGPSRHKTRHSAIIIPFRPSITMVLFLSCRVSPASL